CGTLYVICGYRGKVLARRKELGMTEATAGKPTLERRLSLSALAVSFVALILSQFHPLYTYLDKPKLIVSVSQNAQVYHGFGNLGFNVFVQLRNQGKVVG